MSVRQIAAAGIVASLVMAMWEMVVEAVIPDGAGLCGAPIASGATLIRGLQGSGNPIPFDGLALILGLMGHMMNSILFAAIFALLARRAALSQTALLAAGMAWGVALFVGMWFVVAPIVDPLLLNLNGLAFFLAHLMWGGALGWLWARRESTDALPPTSRIAIG